MYQIKIKHNEAGQRFDKFLQKFMPEAPVSFFYKMLRKKNITLNGNKAEGREKLSYGDEVSFFLSEETFLKFTGRADHGEGLIKEYEEAYKGITGVEIVYENRHVILVNKPAGVLTQKAERSDQSLNEWIIGYLLQGGKIKKEELLTFKPSICNRLDRNTSGLVIGAKTLAGAQKMNELISGREVHKYYRLYVKGNVTHENTYEGFLIKDEKTNKVQVKKTSSRQNEKYSRTRYYPVQLFTDRTLLEAELITGKTHQIRVHLAETGHPLLGDYKYGDKVFNDQYKSLYGINSQLLHAYRLTFPHMSEPFEDMDELTVTAELPDVFKKLTENK